MTSSLPSRLLGRVVSMSTVDRMNFSRVFQDCSALNAGKQAHARMILSGFIPTPYVTNCLIHMYIRCSDLVRAAAVFDVMPERDTVSWNAMIFGYAASGDMLTAESFFEMMPRRDVVSWNSMMSGYMKNGSFRDAVMTFARMRNVGVTCDSAGLAIVLKACSSTENVIVGVQIHALAVRMGFLHDVVAASALVDLYGKCKRLRLCHQLFHELQEKNWVSWSAVIAACVQNDDFVGGAELFKEMLRAGCEVSQSIYASVFRACAALSAVSLGSQFQGHSLKTNFGTDVIVGTATLDMYAKCDNLSAATKCFTHLPHRSLQSYNAIIVSCARNSRGLEAMQLFLNLRRTALKFDDITLSGAFRACAVIKGLSEGLQLHGLAVKSTFASDVCVTNAMLDMYGKCGALSQAQHVFDDMVRRDAVSWNSIIAAHEQNDFAEQTLILFVLMLRSAMEPDEFTYGSVLKACAGGQIGTEIHGRIIKAGMGFDSFVGSALVDMYSKCGKLEDAQKLHDRIEGETIMAWNAIISGFSTIKQSEDAQKLFSKMLEMGVKPDNFTYATVLDTCANLATGELGKQIHAQIIKQELQADAYIASTLVDMYSKCGDMHDSEILFEKAPKRDLVTWNAMICGYTHHGPAKMALEIFERMKIENVRPNQTTFISILRACAHMGLVDKGFHYFLSMSKEYNLEPQMEHYACMVDIMGRCGRVSEAYNFVNEMPFAADDVIWRTLLSVCKMHGNVEVAEMAV
uniref:Pentatricopeptide repeat-containing protein n=1 Tax=Kalanchoe fedtschenkoi TaxID=63787 RepID=A0A7N0UHK2_KALFE